MKTPPRPNGNNEIGPFVIKSHHSDLKIITEMIEHYGKAPFHIPIHLFTSSRDDDHDVSDFSEFSDISLYQQKLPNLYNCSLCEIDNYAPIFGLTPEDLRLLKEYMSNFEILRQCCGLQQSKYNRYRLHGCNVTQLLADQPAIRKTYPYCERHDMAEIETQFAALPIEYGTRSDGDWKKPGDCARFEEKIVTLGADFNGKKFKSCDTFLDTYSSETIATSQRQRIKILNKDLDYTTGKITKRTKRKKLDRSITTNPR
mmetsp:Transcript_26142/g.56028  ORF Transcript_26142/g.56028 Transcript_26142/m.56028 type:complete len:257 (+) Transcript_26142:2-772(+)